MEKRFVSFLLASLVVLFGFSYLQQAILGPEIEAQRVALEAERQAAKEAEAAADGDAPAAGNAPAEAATAEPKADQPAAAPATADKPAPPAAAEVQPPAVGPEQLVMLGSLDPESPYQMLVTFSNVGAAVQRVELNAPEYTDLLDESGYLGNLSLIEEEGKCFIRTVAEGSPAFDAGLRGREWNQGDVDNPVAFLGDRLKSVNDQAIDTPADLRRVLRDSKPGEEVNVTVDRAGELIRTKIALSKRPLQLLQPEPMQASDDKPAHPASFLLTLNRIGAEKTRFDADELPGIPSLHNEAWAVKQLAAAGNQGPGVEFSRTLSADELAAIGADTTLELVKRYRLALVDREKTKTGAEGYNLTLALEIRNAGDKPIEVGFQLDGPTGLTLEGWWYSYKVHPTKMSVAGARDVVWRERNNKHKLFVCGAVNTHQKKNPDSPELPLIDSTDPVELAYLGTDAQYFSAVMISDAWDPDAKRGEPGTPGRLYDSAFARAVGPIDTKKRRKATDVSTRLKSRPKSIAAGESIEDSFTIFLGPKEPTVLAEYGLDECIVYGWFWWVAKPMRAILHGFYWMTGKWSYGLAIILLTVLVRALLFPFGRQMARNAQKMQELAPEMKKIADKYKDVEKRSKAQQELFKKHNYNPLSGCAVLFIQTPVFLGLYRCIGTDISLRQAPLIPGLDWCTNLAGPDRFWNWQDTIPAALSATTGWLGPYLNLLPLVAVGLILAQQKLFTPPAQDEQQQMQQSVMKFMMIFMCLIFFKFASGLCLYIIVSTLWGLGERLMLPKPNQQNAQAAEPIAVAAATGGTGGNGSAKKKRNKKPRKR